MTDDKLLISANDLLEDSWRLAARILQDGFRPDHVIGVWRGGGPVAVAVHEALDAAGVHADTSAVRTRAYDGVDQQASHVEITGLTEIASRLTPEDSILIVDDVFETGRSLETLLQAMKTVCGERLPHTIRTSVVWYKPERNTTTMKPDYFLHQTDRWLVFPHELSGLSPEEIAMAKPAVHELTQDQKASGDA